MAQTMWDEYLSFRDEDTVNDRNAKQSSDDNGNSEVEVALELN